MRPDPRQKIYKFYFFENLLHLITFNLFNLNKTKILENHFKKMSLEGKLGPNLEPSLLIECNFELRGAS